MTSSITEKAFLATAAALGGYFSVVAAEPSTRFYNILREAEADSSAICWEWFSFVNCFVALAALHQNGGDNLDPSEGPTQVLTTFVNNMKAIGINSEDDLERISKDLGFANELISKHCSGTDSNTMPLGLAIAERLGCTITNPMTLFNLGQEVVQLFKQIHEKFETFCIILDDCGTA